MISVKLTIEGDNRLREKLNRLMKPELYEGIIDYVADETVKKAKEMSPIDTGRLRKSIHKESGGKMERLIVADPVDDRGHHYAVYVEYGCKTIDVGSIENPKFGKSGYHPFLRPAAYRSAKKASEKFGKEIRAIFD